LNVKENTGLGRNTGQALVGGERRKVKTLSKDSSLMVKKQYPCFIYLLTYLLHGAESFLRR
jgi:hypothetical protein